MAFKSREKVRQFAQTRGVELNEYGTDGFWSREGSTIVYHYCPKKKSEKSKLLNSTILM